MAPLPYESADREPVFRCPRCDDDLLRSGHVTTCSACGYVPKQGSD